MKANMMTQDKLLSRQQAAEFLGVTKGTLEVWACTKRYNLPYVKVGKLVKYRQSDLIQFLNDRTVYQTAPQS
jgi:excisionase family DNA binding protein